MLDSEVDRQRKLDEAIAESSIEQISSNFGPGSFGEHELLDRIHVFSHLWESLLMNHPSLLLDEKTHQAAFEIETLIGTLYASVGRRVLN